MIVVLDINGQPDRLLHPFAQGLSVAPITTIILSGASSKLGKWVEKIKSEAPKTMEIKALRVKDRQSESLILLAAAATSHYLQHSGPDERWVVISQREGFAGLAEHLHSLGSNTAYWTPAPTVDFLSTLMHSTSDHSLFIRDVADKLIREAGNKPIAVARLANTVITLVPELANQEHRKELFGAIQFSLICKAVGLTIKDNYVQPLRRG